MHTDGVTVFSQWPLQHFFDYIFSFDSIVSNLQYPRECQGELWIIVRGDGLPCGGESWCQMSISFANHGHLARTLSYHWTVNVALCGEKSTSVLSQVWANNLAFLQSALDSGVVPIRGASRRCRIFCGGDSPWLRRLSGVATHWMAGSLFSYMTWCKSSATWLQQDVDRTTERDEQLLGLIAPGAKCRPMDIFGVVQSRLFSGEILEGSNRVLKAIWSSFCDRGGGAGTLVKYQGGMGTPEATCAMQKKLADEVRAYFADEELW